MLSQIFKPYKTNDLIRLGPKEDGGYVVNKCAVINSDLLISFGLGSEFRFEKKFRLLNSSKIICFDHSVNFIFWIKFFCITLKYIFLKFNFYKLKNFFVFFDYLFFFSLPNNYHEKKKIVNFKKDRNQLSIKKFFSSITKNNIFLKIDIEGDEIFILQEIVKYEHKIYALIIEFHNLLNNKKILENFIKDLRFLTLTHIHANNFGKINTYADPDVLELTFLNFKKKKIKKIRSQNIYPIKKLDFPNNSLAKDIKLSFRE
jgi:hypothetical protein